MLSYILQGMYSNKMSSHHTVDSATCFFTWPTFQVVLGTFGSMFCMFVRVASHFYQEKQSCDKRALGYICTLVLVFYRAEFQKLGF